MELTQKQWKEFLSFKEEYQENETKHNLLLQKQNDILEGGIRSANLKEYRNTYIVNAQDSLDETYPLYVHFNIIPEMVKIVSIQLSFWFLNFRAYATAATEKESVTSGASSAASSAGGGGQTSSQAGDHVHALGFDPSSTSTVLDHYHVYYKANSQTLLASAHAHTVDNHTHNIPHTHSVPAHTHGITYGIFEEKTSPTVIPFVSRDNGLTYSLPMGSYTKDQSLDITRFIDNAGSKIIKFESNARTRLSVQVTIKLDIKAR